MAWTGGALQLQVDDAAGAGGYSGSHVASRQGLTIGRVRMT
jgi:hypothetical protein